MSFKPQVIAEYLVNKYRLILMNEDTDCGHEVLCSFIAIKFAKSTINEQINEVKTFSMIYDKTSYCDKRIKHLENVLIELDKL